MTAPDRLRVFLDADVIVAGSASAGGASRLILRLGALGLIEAISSAVVRQEVERVLRSKLPAALAPFGVLADEAVSWVAAPTRAQRDAHGDHAHPADVHVVAAAVREGCSHIVTFNVRDFRVPAEMLSVRTPGGIVDELRAHLARLANE